MSESETPRIGVFVCHCGHNIAGVVDVVRLAKEAASFPNVVFSTDEMFMCADGGQGLIRRKIKEFELNRVVVASCSPRMHEPTFRRVVEEAGLNRYLFEQVNLREHVSWCHMRQPEAATQKAIDLVRMSVARAAMLQELPVKKVDVFPSTLVVGSGIAGLTAALDIADRGFDAVIVEKDKILGGHVAKWTHLFPSDQIGEQVIEPLVERLMRHEKVRVLRDSRVVKFDGYIGNFDVTVQHNPTGSQQSFKVGAAIIATGFEPFKPIGYYAYGKSPDIITLAELQEMPRRYEIFKPSNGRLVNRLAFIGCVGSREPGLKGHEHCSRHCCAALAKAASDLRERVEEVIVLYQDIRTYGRGHEELHRLARSRNVIYSKFPPDDKPKVEIENGRPTITWYDVLSEDELKYEPDLIVLASAMLPPSDIEETAKMFSLTRSGDGFFNPEHIKLAPLTTHTAGIMIAGAAQAAKNAHEAAIDASGAAAKAVSLMARGQVEIESTIAQVNSERCSSCHTCVSACPYGAMAMDYTVTPEVAFVTEAKCHGCGTCAGGCPSGAITMLHSTDDQILTMVQAYLGSTGGQQKAKIG
ncbi:MAG: CoB--CoM heterodisulfide reductase iron-sulfur subunit A family protein [Candidatus Thorarchaeota archaeon]